MGFHVRISFYRVFWLSHSPRTETPIWLWVNTKLVFVGMSTYIPVFWLYMVVTHSHISWYSPVIVGYSDLLPTINRLLSVMVCYEPCPYQCWQQAAGCDLILVHLAPRPKFCTTWTTNAGTLEHGVVNRGIQKRSTVCLEEMPWNWLFLEGSGAPSPATLFGNFISRPKNRSFGVPQFTDILFSSLWSDSPSLDISNLFDLLVMCRVMRLTSWLVPGSLW